MANDPQLRKAAPDARESASTELKAKIETQVGELVQGKSREQVVERVFQLVQSEAFRGPLPHPKHLSAYEQILPGAAERIVSMAEKALAANIDTVTTAQRDDAAERKLGLWLGFGALLFLIIGAVISVWLKEPVATASFLGVGAFGTVARFILGKDGNGTTTESEKDES